MELWLIMFVKLCNKAGGFMVNKELIFKHKIG